MNNHSQAFTEFSTTFKKMREKLIEWAQSKGGTLDREGYMTGLTANDQTHFDIRNAQLETIATYATMSEKVISDQLGEIERLRGKVRILETANRELLKSDTEVEKHIDELLSYEIQEDTTLTDFEDTLKDTIYYFELGLKRQLIQTDAHIENKIKWAKVFLRDTNALKRFFYQKKKQLDQTHDSIAALIQTTPHN